MKDFFNNPVATPEEVTNLHKMSDVDSSTYAQHHTLGRGPLQAAPGDLSYSKTETYSKTEADTKYFAKDEFAAVAGGLTANQAIPQGVWTDVTAMVIQHVKGTGITNLANNYFRIDKAGYYNVDFQVGIQGGGTGTIRACRIILTPSGGAGASVSRFTGGPNGNFEGGAITHWAGNLSLNDVINFQAFHDHSAALSVMALENQTKFEIKRLITN